MAYTVRHIFSSFTFLLAAALLIGTVNHAHGQATDADSVRSERSARSATEGRSAAREAGRKRSASEAGRPPVHPRHQARLRPHVRVDVAWPWPHRFERRWSPLYRYRQVVHVDAGWGRRHRSSRLDVRTYYRHRVQHASARRADVDVFIDRIEIFDNGFFVGVVRDIPAELGRVGATMYRGGPIRFDRDLFIVGDPYVGFEIVSTRHYEGFVLDRYDRSHGFRAGVLDFRRERVRHVRRSRFFDPHDFNGFVPIHLLPEDESWLADYGRRSPSRYWYGDAAAYYYGILDDYSHVDDLEDYYLFDGDRTDYDRVDPRGAPSGSTSTHSSRRLPETEPLERSDEETIRTESGATIRMKRESSLERVE